MLNNKQQFFRALMLTLPVLCAAQTARAYVDLAPNLPKIIGDAPTIALVEVTGYDRTAHIVTFKSIKVLKGTLSGDTIAHQVAPVGGVAPRQIVQWAVPGSRAVIFQSRTEIKGTALVSLGTGWYQVNSVGTGAWKLGPERPDLPLAYYGSVSRLADGVEAMLKGQGAVITQVAYGSDNAAASFDLALNRQSLPGVVRLQRVRATANMNGSAMSSSPESAAFIGMGVVDERDLPLLLEQLAATDPNARAQALEELRTLGRKAKSAAPRVVGLLKDATPRVRFAAASALLRLTPKNKLGVETLLAGLNDSNPVVRHYATVAAGYSGKAGAPLTEKLAALLTDPDEGIRLTALESLSMLGPVATPALPALITLLDNKDLMIDAADALGRIGPAAKAALPKLTTMLASDQATVRWAAVRGMSQIGGPDARPAVEFMVKVMPTATEVEGYNMMIYFSMLGPAARDAVSALQNFRIKNPFLPSTTQWAINPTTLPWAAGGGMGGFGGGGGPGGMGGGGGGGRGGGRGGMGGPGGGMGGMSDFMYAAYVQELGPRLATLSPVLAKAIMDNTAGEVPLWGYELLNAAPEQSLAILTPYLKNSDMLIRERAAVAIGYMEEAGAPAKAQVEAALAQAPLEREKKLLQWTLRQIDED